MRRAVEALGGRAGRGAGRRQPAARGSRARRARSSRATATSPAISAASILAKTARDALLVELDAPLSGVRLRAQQGLRHARAPRGAGAARPVSGAPAQLRAGRAGRRSTSDAPRAPVGASCRVAARSRSRCACVRASHAASARSIPMIHCVLHDPSDSVAVVVVEGVKAGTTLTGLILDEDRTITLALRAGHPARPQGRAEGHGGRRHGHQVRRRHRQGGRADREGRSTRTSTTSRPSGGERMDRLPNTTFRGYRRENGRVGVRNHVIILPVDDLSNAACRGGRQQHQGHAGDPASLRPAAVRRRPRPAFPHADRHRLAIPTSPRSS